MRIPSLFHTRPVNPDVLIAEFGFFETTMNPAFSGAINASNLQSDIAAADGKMIIVRPGNYTVSAVDVSTETVNLWFLPGTTLQATAGTVKLFQFTDCLVDVEGLYIDGNQDLEVGFRCDDCDTVKGRNWFFIDIGDPAVANSSEVHAVILKTCAGIEIDGIKTRNVNAKGNGTYGDNVGSARDLLLYNCFDYYISNINMSGAETGEDKDFIHFLDDRGTVLMRGRLENVVIEYNEFARRCLKYQGGYHTLSGANISKASDFTAVSGSTNVGEQNLNCVDWASGIVGTLRVVDSYIDASGFFIGVSNSGGTGGKVVVENCRIVGGTLDCERNNPETGAPEDLQTIGFFTTGNDEGSVLRDSYIVNFKRGAVPQGAMNQIINNVFDDPIDLWLDAGSSTQKNGLDIIGNRVITRTSGAMGTTRCGRVQNNINIRIAHNQLLQSGNTTHAARFVECTNSSATGKAWMNDAPSATPATLPVYPGAGTGVKIMGNRNNMQSPFINTTTVGNVGTGEDNLMSYNLPIQTMVSSEESIKIRMIGASANNANAKTLNIYIGTAFGGTGIIATLALTAAQANIWIADITLTYTGANAQRFFVKLNQYGTVAQETVAAGDLTETASANINIRATGTATSNNDITQTFMSVESLSGRVMLY